MLNGHSLAWIVRDDIHFVACTGLPTDDSVAGGTLSTWALLQRIAEVYRDFLGPLNDSVVR